MRPAAPAAAAAAKITMAAASCSVDNCTTRYEAIKESEQSVVRLQSTHGVETPASKSGKGSWAQHVVLQRAEQRAEQKVEQTRN